MHGKETKHDAFARLREWLENGDQTLDREMEEGLYDEAAPQEPAADDREFITTRRKRSAVTKKNNRREKHQNIRESGRAYADAWWYRLAAAAVCISLIGLMLYAAMQMPQFGNADTLVGHETTAFYVTHTMEETGAVNIVTGIILDYRGFDTLGESHVLFVAGSTVLLLLSIRGEKDERELLAENIRQQCLEPDNDLILQGGARILLPLVLIFGLYIILNGHLSPGGGFSGGAVLGAGLILYQNAFGYERTERFFTYRTFRMVSVASLLFYATAKGYHFLTGANHMESGIPKGTAGAILSGGLLLPLNIAVGCVVTCTMYALYTMFRKGAF